MFMNEFDALREKDTRDQRDQDAKFNQSQGSLSIEEIEHSVEDIMINRESSLIKNLPNKTEVKVLNDSPK